MKGRIIAAATAVVLAAFATSLDAKPIKVVDGANCPNYYHVTGEAGNPFLFQTFKPTFSTLKSISLVLFGGIGGPLADDVTLRLRVFKNAPGALLQQALVDSVLLAGTGKTDANAGYTITFTFTAGVPVDPEQDYTFQISQVDFYPDDLVWACYSSEDYTDGAFYLDSTPQSEDLAFKATGSGRGTAPK